MLSDVTLVGQQMFIWNSVFTHSGGNNGKIPEAARISSFSSMEPVKPQFLVEFVQCSGFFGSSVSPKYGTKLTEFV